MDELQQAGWGLPGTDSYIHKTLRPFSSNLLLAPGEIVTRKWVTGWTQGAPDWRAGKSFVWSNTMLAALLMVGRLEICPIHSGTYLACGYDKPFPVVRCRKWQLMKNFRWKTQTKQSWEFILGKRAGFESCALPWEGIIKKRKKTRELIKAERNPRDHVI